MGEHCGVTVALVLNRNASPSVVHRPSCPTIQHQVNGDVRQELPAGGFQVIESYPDGTALVGANEGVDTWLYEAVYVTPEELLTSRRRYRRCGVCAPDVPDAPGPSLERAIRGESLRRHHLGREFRGIGRLREYRCTESGWTLIGVHGEMILTEDTVIYYAKAE